MMMRKILAVPLFIVIVLPVLIFTGIYVAEKRVARLLGKESTLDRIIKRLEQEY